VREIRFTVYGTPRPQGSTRAFIPKGWKRAVITTDNARLKPWRQEVVSVIVNLNTEPFAAHTPLRCHLDFYFERPKSASPKKRPGMTTKPDSDKLMRALFDSMKGVLIDDDAQIVNGQVRKFYGTPERVEVIVSEDLP
jgi:Holliday junction resolvase RusA-like endonuclease